MYRELRTIFFSNFMFQNFENRCAHAPHRFNSFSPSSTVEQKKITILHTQGCTSPNAECQGCIPHATHTHNLLRPYAHPKRTQAKAVCTPTHTLARVFRTYSLTGCFRVRAVLKAVPPETP